MYGYGSIAQSGTAYGIYARTSTVSYGGTSFTQYGLYVIVSCCHGQAWAIYGVGNAHITGTLTQGSDRRFKENIRPIENPLEKIMSLQGTMYDRKPIRTGKLVFANMCRVVLLLLLASTVISQEFRVLQEIQNAPSYTGLMLLMCVPFDSDHYQLFPLLMKVS